jgi:MFS family permease
VAIRQGEIGLMYLLLAVIGTTRAVGWPARSAMLPMLVPAEVFPNAVAWNSSFFQVAAMAGPALGGLVVNWSVSWAYLIAAIFSGVFASTALTLKYHHHVERRPEPMTMHSLAAGVKFVSRTKIILATMSLDLFAVLLGGATYLLPIYATVYLHVGSVGFGWLRAAPAVGALIMGLVVAHLPMKHAGRSMLWAVAGFGAATIVFGLSHNFWLSCFMLLLTGATDNVSVMVRHTLVQILTPDEMRGRVSAVNNVFIGASNEIGGFESGLTAKLFGPVVSVVGGGIGTIVVVAVAALIWPDLRKFGSLHAAREETPESPPGFEVVPITVPAPEGKAT